MTRLPPAEASRTGRNFGSTALRVPLAAVFAFAVRFFGTLLHCQIQPFVKRRREYLKESECIESLHKLLRLETPLHVSVCGLN